MSALTQSTAQHRLGAREARFGANLLGTHGWAPTFAALVGLITTPLICYFTIQTLIRQGLAGLFEDGFIIALLIWPFLTLFGLRTARDMVARREDYVTLYKDGFTYLIQQTAGERRWEEVREIVHITRPHYYKGAYSRTLHGYIIRSQTQADIPLESSINGLQELATSIRGHVQSRLVAEATRKLETGQAVQFGALTLTSVGLNTGGRSISWKQVSSVENQARTEGTVFPALTEIEDLVVSSSPDKQPWARIPVADIPNEFVALELASTFLNKATG